MSFNKIINKFAPIILIALLVVAFNVVIDLGSMQPANQVAALNNGLALTPPMGWNSWNIFHGNINETQIKQIADTMVSSGMRDAGYVYLNLDDNWMANPARDANGNLRADPTRFPSGMKVLGDYIHSKGLKFGIYGDRGTMTCMNVPQSGSYGNEQRDANTFASWGVDYLKYDNCNAVGNMQTAYTNMKNALASCGRPIVFSICAWQFQSWMPETGNLWRVSDDIVDTWDNGTNWGKGIIECIDANRDLASYAKSGAWNDPDMLEIGNSGYTTEEYRTQMSMWCIMTAPLIAGNDIRTMSQTTKDILLNSEVIAIDQDPAGIQGTRVSASNGLEVWCKPLGSANGTSKAVALLNRTGGTANITVNFASIGLSGTVMVRDLWAKVDRGTFSGSYTMSVPSHGTGMLKLTSGTSPTPTPTPGPRSAFSQLEAESYNTQSGIQTESCGEGGQNIGYIENGDYVVYNNIDFGSGATSFQARVASATSGGNIEIRLDSITGPLVGTCSVAGTGGWQTWVTRTCSVSGATGTHNLYLRFTGGSGYLFNVNWFQFTPATSNLITNPGMETGNTSSWTVNGAGSIAVSTAQKHSGTYSLYHTGRTATWNGPLQNITSKVQSGKTYACSGWVRLDNATSGTIIMTIKKVDDSGTTYTNVATGTGSNNSWVQLSGNYTLTVSGTLTELSIYFEGPGSGINYYVDDVSVQ